MTDYVLIHGAWHGSWCWARVRRLLAAAAHRVFTPTLTGVGERSHLLSRDVGLDTHIADVANLMIWENLRDVVLVGHSYGGFVARHVADRMPDRIRSLIYLDAFVPENGKTLFDYLPDNGGGPWRWLESSAEAGVVLRGQCGRRPLGGQSVHDAPAVQF